MPITLKTDSSQVGNFFGIDDPDVLTGRTGTG
jgi:hypothetical protein